MRNKIGRRKSEMWISNNKVLIGGGTKKPHARNPNFETEETKLLISLWGDPKVQKTLITTHKKHPVIAKLAEKMREHGYYRSPEEINTRIKNLKCFYNRIKKDLETGVTAEPSWRHFTAMDDILTRPIFGNRVQQPHLQHLNADTKTDEDPKELRPEDLLEVEEDIEDEDDPDVDFEDGSVIPKDEPIDIDDIDDMIIEEDENGATKADEVDDVADIFPKLSYYLQLTSNSALKGANGATIKSKTAAIGASSVASDEDIPQILNIKSSPASSPVPDDNNITTTATSSAAKTTTKMIFATPIAVSSGASTTTTSSTATANKISLVPTNILMKPSTGTTTPQSTAAKFSFKPQQFLCTKPTGAGANNGQMKVLLVNTLQKPQMATSTAAVTAVTTLPTRSIVNLQPKIQVSTAITSSSAPYQTRSATAIANASTGNLRPLAPKKYLSYTSSRTSSPTPSASSSAEKRSAASWKKNAPGFRTLLSQLVQLQNKTLDISRQRLDVEKQRLSFERETGDKILNLLSTLLQQRKNDTDSPEQ